MNQPKQRGFTLPEAMFAVGVSAVSLLAAFALMSQFASFQTQYQRQLSLLEVRNEMMGHLLAPTAWKNTLNDPTNASTFSCLLSFTNCPVHHPQSFNLLNHFGDSVYAPAYYPNVGFTEKGVQCGGFDPVAGNPDCPFRLELKWEPLCTSACAPGLIRITGQFLYSPGPTTDMPVNVNAFGFELRLPTLKPPEANILSVTALEGTTLILLDNGEVMGWGANHTGAIGAGYLTPSPGFVAAATQMKTSGGVVITDAIDILDGSSTHACVVRMIGGARQIHCTGENQKGDLGVGSVSLPFPSARPMVDATLTPFASTNLVRFGSARSAFGYLLDSTLGVMVWGYNRGQRFGTDYTVDTVYPSLRPHNQLNSLGVPIHQLAFGRLHGCAIVGVNREVICWGENDAGQLGRAPTAPGVFAPPNLAQKVADPNGGFLTNVKEIAAEMTHTCAQTNDNRLVCWGHNQYGQLGAGFDTPAAPYSDGNPRNALLHGPVDQFSLGRDHTCVVYASGVVDCWGGNNSFGELGRNHTTPALTHTPMPVVGLPPGSHPIKISAGTFHTCVLLSDHSLMCWGRNDQGELGIGSASGSGIPSAQLVIAY